MTKDFLEILRCPSCAEQFSSLQVVRVNFERILYGVVQCRCSVYPIVDGILIFKNDDKTRRILHFVAKGETWKALKLSFDYKPDLNKLLLATASNAGIGYRLLGYLLCIATLSKSRSNIPLFRLLDLAGKLRIQVFWTTYLKHRFSATSFWCALPFVDLVNGGNKRLLDIGCGMGVFSYAFSKQIPEEQIVCQNLEFAGLYLARKYFVPKANFICSDAGEDSPFPDGAFDVVFSCDALQYIEKKEHACEEISRLINRGGLAILAHNHAPNRRDYISQGFRGDFYDPSSAEAIFAKLGVKAEVVNEEIIYNSLFPNMVIDDQRKETA